MEAPHDFKAIVFAFGNVGHRIVDFFLSRSPNSLAKIIVDQEREPDTFRALCARIGSNAVLSWQQAIKQSGADLKSISADVAVLAWWPHILRQPLLGNVARKATLNLHPSLLPHCRGKDPYFWSIVEGRPFGVTIHHVSEEIDAGDIAFQEEIAVEWEDTAATLHHKAEAAMIRLFENSFARISRCDIPRIPQNLAAGSLHMRRELDSASVIDLERQYSGRQILNLLRARTFPPHPGCRFVDGGRTYEVRVNISRAQ